MKVYSLFTSVSIFVLFGWMTAARADFDVSPRWSGVAGDPLVTYGFDDGPPEIQSANPMRVFEFGFDNPGLNTTTDPGIHAVSAEEPDPSLIPSGLPNGSKVSFDILSDLQYWNGGTFTAVPAGETLLLQIGTSSRTIGTGTGSMAGFTIGKVGPPSFGDEELHVHFSSTLTGPGGIDPTDGVYAFVMDLKSDNASITTSLSYYVLYDHNAPAGAIDDAAAFAETLVPEPASLTIAALGGCMMAVGWRRLVHPKVGPLANES